MKVLLSSYACEPGMGSEPGLGWNVAREVAKRHDVWLLTRPDESREQIEAAMAADPNPRLKFVYCSLPIWKDSRCLGESGGMQVHYYLWQIQAYRMARRLHGEIGFDVAHHVTHVKYYAPSLMSRLPIPFVFGPVGGGESTPPAFMKDFSLKARIYEFARGAVRRIGESDPLVRQTIRDAAVVRAPTQDSAARLRRLGAHDVEIVTESALDDDEIARLAQCAPPGDGPPRFISLGRLLHWKGFHLGLEAFAKAAIKGAEYWIVGDGPELERLKRQAAALGIASKVRFWGRLTRDETLARLADCHVLVHPSLHDAGGMTCLEGMAMGRPPICLDLGGPGAKVHSDAGVKVAAHTPEQAIADIAAAMTRLGSDPELRARMGAVGRRHVEENYRWSAIGDLIDATYRRLTLPRLPDPAPASSPLQDPLLIKGSSA